jgi:hypothetical protein
MPHIDILIGNTPPLYREVLAATFCKLRPEFVVCAVPHTDLDDYVCKFRPLLVICSNVSTTISSHSPAWIALYPDDKDEAIVSIDGRRRSIPNATVLELLSVLDDVRSSILVNPPTTAPPEVTHLSDGTTSHIG